MAIVGVLLMSSSIAVVGYLPAVEYMFVVLGLGYGTRDSCISVMFLMRFVNRYSNLI